MDDARFDRLVAVLATGPSRRRLLQTVFGFTLAGLLGRPDSATGRRRRNRRQTRKNCPPNRPRCGNKCCQQDETCRRGKCKHHCEDGARNFGESATDCGRVCDGVLGDSPFGRCRLRQRCEGGEDCRSAFCEEIDPGAGKVCVDCNIDQHCDLFADGRPRCLDHFCFECAADFDCPGSSNPPEERFCVFLPVAAGLNEAPCPPGQPCVCRECRTDGDCPTERPRCQTGTGTVFDGQCFECVEDIHCPEGQLCDEQGRCEGFECESNRDCPRGRACEDGACTGSCIPPGGIIGDDEDRECCSGVECISGPDDICCDFGQACIGPGDGDRCG